MAAITQYIRGTWNQNYFSITIAKKLEKATCNSWHLSLKHKQSLSEGQSEATEPQQTTVPSAPGARQGVSATTSLLPSPRQWKHFKTKAIALHTTLLIRIRRKQKLCDGNENLPLPCY